MRHVSAWGVLLLGVVGAGASCGSQGNGKPAPTPPTYETRDNLLDPSTCNKCHADHYRDWSGSMHAYASDDPVFVAMNKRGQRETGGALGDFCVKCHAPLAVHEGKTRDGLNLGSIDAKYKGVNCFYCHAVDAVEGAHDNPLHLASDIVMRGPFGDPVANTAHPAAYASLQDRDHLASANLCGPCHDIVNGHGVSIERTFQEWQNTVFHQVPGGATCSQCHMTQSTNLVAVAQAPGVHGRYYHSHDFPGVDVALTAFPQSDAQKQSVQAFLDTTIQSSLCVGEGAAGITVILDNVAAGHGWPSGSAQDRRLWIELVAYSAGKIILQSGVVSDGTAVTTLADPDLWLLRDCMLDSQDKEVSMFWQAEKPSESYQLPGTVTFDRANPAFFQTHIYRTYPQHSLLTAAPDRVTMRVRIQPIGLDVVDDLIASHDLDPSYRAKMPTFDVGTTPLVEWTPATARFGYTDANTRTPFTCVTNSNASFVPQVPAASHVHCKP
jgi:hypothetical protein